ncbi:hypothetical protein AN639_01930 [Candidatus Epulonipiscium fishelsonii]|uniref:Uncharacterized protein n=1 Tax=Candidatus Epulonipiscium fishelsonii TaxID=77094 RepID=A0ACC8X8Q5_9FIRM|nr:hypothetical protein AN396_10890 [Epulopiscium sp. SCG-B11WGA-EpuloA1]ONI38963.1 hypothetical protein AN639_01930 [Epulopiscium sp. SCG-B05WGA-EpuloA1]ONI47485.1 hypothetical protein AN644_05160 [Epulopiscium sp. SCG-C06WGA-EpuloA1]
MNVKECIKGAFQQLWGSKLRTFLTMLGMFIGIGSVIMVLSVGDGVTAMVNDTFSDIGKGTVTIAIEDRRYEYLITKDDIEAIEGMKEVDTAVAYDTTVEFPRNYKNEQRMLQIVGVPYNYDAIQNIEIVAGRMTSEAEDRAKAKVVVVSDKYGPVMFGHSSTESILGKTIEMSVNGYTDEFEVIGLVESIDFPGMPEEQIPLFAYMPYTAMTQLNGSGSQRSYMAGVKVNDAYDPNEIGYQIGRLLDKRHRTEDNYPATAAIQIIDQINSVLDMLTIFISFVAGISLLVGGIGIMNIMLVTVKERTREIGIRKAIGATNGEILTQFLVEAVILTWLGGLIGMLFGYSGGVIAGSLMDMVVTLTPSMVIFAVGTSSFIGITFGVYPAYQASKLDPIEALRYE